MIDYAATGRRPLTMTTLLVAVIAAAVIAMPGRRGWFDVGVYHDAAVYWLRHPGHLYDFVRGHSGYGFTYPPFAALCMLPMAWLSWHATVAVNLVVGLAALGFLVHRLVGPVAADRGWPRWRAYVWAAALLAVYEPVRDTIEYGQVNLLLMALVYADLALLEGRFRRYAGVGVGLAAAIKLTPGVFIVYLLVRRRWRAAAVASATLAAATGVAALLAPTATRMYFGRAVWDTGRVGQLAYVSNQSLMGLVARVYGRPEQLAWLVLAGAVVAVWFRQVRRAPDDRVGFALTGVLACLLSPVTWIHHLVWLLPALLAVATAPRRRLLTISAYLLTGSGVVWIWWRDHSGPLGMVGSNLGTLAAIAVLLVLPRSVWPERSVVGEPGRAIGEAGDDVVRVTGLADLDA